MSVEAGAAAPRLVEAGLAAAGLMPFFAADFEGLFAPDAPCLEAPFTALVDFFDLLFAIVSIHLLVIVPTTIELPAGTVRLEYSSHR